MALERISKDRIAEENARIEPTHRLDLEAVAGQLERRGMDVEALLEQAAEFSVALPTWGFARGGTRFGRFPIAGEPRSLEEKLVHASIVNDLTAVTPRVSPHIPWDTPSDAKAARRLARELGLGFDAINSNTFQDQPGQAHSYLHGSLSHTEAAVRNQAIAHNWHCLELGEVLGSKALTVWLADGSNFPGQQNFRHALERTMDSLAKIYARLPKDWRMLVEYKPYEPAFYATVLNDWGTALMTANALGSQAFCLVDLGHHLPNTNIEQVVSRLIQAGKLGGFHFNDSKYSDDDLSSGAIKPFQLFLIFCELLDAAADPVIRKRKPAFRPAYMIDQSHNLKDPVEDLIGSAVAIHRAYVKALLVDRKALQVYQGRNDAAMAERVLQGAFEMDVSAILAEVRRRRGAAIDPLLVSRALRSDGSR